MAPSRIILPEAYSKAQILRNTGGPRDLDMLLSCTEVAREFPNCIPILLQETEREIIEGRPHTGLASVVQFSTGKAHSPVGCGNRPPPSHSGPGILLPHGQPAG